MVRAHVNNSTNPGLLSIADVRIKAIDYLAAFKKST